MADHLCPLGWVWPLLSDHSPVWYLIVLITADVLSVCREAQSDLGRLFLIQITLYSSIFIFTSKKVHIALDIVLQQMWRYWHIYSAVSKWLKKSLFAGLKLKILWWSCYASLLRLCGSPSYSGCLQWPMFALAAHMRTIEWWKQHQLQPSSFFLFFLNELNQHILNFYLLVKIWGHYRKSPLKTERY